MFGITKEQVQGMIDSAKGTLTATVEEKYREAQKYAAECAGDLVRDLRGYVDTGFGIAQEKISNLAYLVGGLTSEVNGLSGKIDDSSDNLTKRMDTGDAHTLEQAQGLASKVAAETAQGVVDSALKASLDKHLAKYGLTLTDKLEAGVALDELVTRIQDSLQGLAYAELFIGASAIKEAESNGLKIGDYAISNSFRGSDSESSTERILKIFKRLDNSDDKKLEEKYSSGKPMLPRIRVNNVKDHDNYLEFMLVGGWNEIRSIFTFVVQAADRKNQFYQNLSKDREVQSQFAAQAFAALFEGAALRYLKEKAYEPIQKDLALVARGLDSLRKLPEMQVCREELEQFGVKLVEQFPQMALYIQVEVAK